MSDADTTGMETTESRNLRKYIIALENTLHMSQISFFLGSLSSITHVHIKFGLKAYKANRYAAASIPGRVPATSSLPDSTYNNSGCCQEAQH